MSETFRTYGKNLLKNKRMLYKGVAFNSNQVEPGMLFFALKGERSHGATYAEDAVRRGAIAVVVDREGRQMLPASLSVDVFLVEDVLLEMQQLAAYYRQLFKGKVIGITGSAGKTTVKELIVHVLSQRFSVAYSTGNFNNHIGLPYSILNSPVESDFYVFEIGSNHPGEIKTLASIMQPDWSMITNIGTAHIGYFGSREAIAREKTDIFRYTRQNGLVFINQMDPYLQKVQTNQNKITLALNNDQVDFTLFTEDITETGCVILKTESGRSFTLQIPGKHQAMNALFAYAVGRVAGMDEESIVRALSSFQPVDKRMQIVRKTPYLIINDAYNANKESTLAAIDYLESLNGYRKIMVFGDIFELGSQSEKIHVEIGYRLKNSSIDRIFLIGKETRTIVDHIQDNRFIYFESSQDLVETLKSEIKKNDAILFKASRGMALEKIIEQWIGNAHVG
jgi:UDP-N-acetylmuramoyl-tripeptide--D-alanyl-D-alanine ligase